MNNPILQALINAGMFDEDMNILKYKDDRVLIIEGRDVDELAIFTLNEHGVHVHVMLEGTEMVNQFYKNINDYIEEFK